MKAINILRLTVISIFFLSLVLVAYLPTENILNSPDESANAFFALKYADTGALKVQSMFDETWSDFVHPRSMLVVDNFIVPIGFVGFPIICGLFAMIFGNWSILLFTPIIAVLAILAWRKSISYIFKNERLADLSALFLLIHPAFWYYSGRAMMHNIAFICFVIFAFYIFICRPLDKIKSRIQLNELLSGLFLGLALTFRASEVIWVLSIVFVLFFIYRKNIVWKQIILFFIGAMIALLPFILVNNNLYGSPITIGYTVGSEISSEASVAQQDALSNLLSPIFNIIFPFGIHEMNILRNVWNYVFILYPWMSVLAIAGMILAFWKKEYRTLLIVTLCLGAWLSLVYGSWNFHDNPNASIITLGNSYVRYWLPIFVLSSVFCAVCVDRIAVFFEHKKPRTGKVSLYLIIGVVVIMSSWLVIFGSDGFVNTVNNINSFAHKKQVVIEQTTEDSIIVVDMADKYLFPNRQVVVPLRNDNVYEAIPLMLEKTSVYYFGITIPRGDVEYLETEIFNDNVVLRQIVTVQDETLYQFILNKK